MYLCVTSPCLSAGSEREKTSEKFLFMSHLTYEISADENTRLMTFMMWSWTSTFARSSTIWFLPSEWLLPGISIAHSGCARYRPLSRLTISGSTQMPN